MFEGCSTVCPKCQHEFDCPLAQQFSTSVRRSLQGLCGGGLVVPSPTTADTSTSTTTNTSKHDVPEVSPSQPIIFVLPTFHLIHQQHPRHDDDRDDRSIAGNHHHHQQCNSPPEHAVRALRQCGWYHENITYQESQELLKDKETGTFLVRDSSDPRYLYSLSVRTDRGPTSVRLHYDADKRRFKLEAEVHLQASMPSFGSVVELVEHYVRQSRQCKSNGSQHVWVDSQGKRYSPIVLLRPLLKEGKAPSLKHLARLAVHAAVGTTTANGDGGGETITDRWLRCEQLAMRLELPASVSQYLTDYPYTL